MEIVPWHYSRIEEYIAAGHIRVDVVLLQVAPADAEGYYSLGATVDYAAVAAEQARVVLVEVNANMPRTSSSRRLHRSRVTASVTSSRVLADSPARPATAAERAVAQNVAAFVPPGATIQLGVIALADAIAGSCTAAGTCGCDPAWSATGWSISTRPGPWLTSPGAA